jgi:hypothetical protein
MTAAAVMPTVTVIPVQPTGGKVKCLGLIAAVLALLGAWGT